MQLTQVADLLLSAGSPRDAARKTLAWLMDFHQARSVALWRAGEGDALALDMGAAVDHEALLATQALWARDRESLLGGTPSTGESRALIPLRVERSFVYLDGVDPRRVDIETIAGVAAVAAKALSRDRESVAEQPSSLEDVRREELVATLRLHEWNIARVARVKGVTRKTIYDWLKKYAIPREHVAKS